VGPNLVGKLGPNYGSKINSVFRVVRQDTKGGQGMTQFGRALAELNIEILCANSSEFGNLAWPTSAVCFGPPLGR
jgi:hypothetical protein